MDFLSGGGDSERWRLVWWPGRRGGTLQSWDLKRLPVVTVTVGFCTTLPKIPSSTPALTLRIINHPHLFPIINLISQRIKHSLWFQSGSSLQQEQTIIRCLRFLWHIQTSSCNVYLPETLTFMSLLCCLQKSCLSPCCLRSCVPLSFQCFNWVCLIADLHLKEKRQRLLNWDCLTSTYPKWKCLPAFHPTTSFLHDFCT